MMIFLLTAQFYFLGVLNSNFSGLDKTEYIDYHQYMKFTSACAGCFAGLACQTRIGIIDLLKKKKEMPVMEIARHFQVTQPTITHHLKYLKGAKILGSKKKGRKVYYFISEKCKKGECGIFI
jgi:predicted transcriptional regulator